MPGKRAKGMRKDGERMKKPWMKRLAAVSLTLALETGAGTLLRAYEEEIQEGKLLEPQRPQNRHSREVRRIRKNSQQ